MLEVYNTDVMPENTEIQAYIAFCKSRGVDKVIIESTVNGNLFVTLEKRANANGWNRWFKAKFVVPKDENGAIDIYGTTVSKIGELIQACESWKNVMNDPDLKVEKG